MARKRKGIPVHGWLVLDKPLGLSSNTALGMVRRALNAQKAGHAGTLDPLATGVLPIALGEATKTVGLVMDGAKSYRFTVIWGAETTTDDLEGEVAETSENRPTEAEILAKLPDFTGTISQVPPAYSAIRVGGERAYKLARSGKNVEMQPRNVEITAFSLVSCVPGVSAEFAVDCAKGTYIRALGRDLARALGTRGHIGALRRTKSGPFGENGAISLDSEGSFGHIARLEAHLIPIATALDDIPALALSADEAGSIRQGGFVELSSGHGFGPEDTVLAQGPDGPVALARVLGNQLRPTRVFNF